jgi:hypothetical protein
MDMKFPAACRRLILGCCLFIMGAVGARGEEMLIAEREDGLYIFRDASGAPAQKKLAEGIRQFVFTRSGHFILEGSDGRLYKGSVDSSLAVKIHLIRSAPIDPLFFTISEDGKRVAWTPNSEGCIGCELIIQEYNGEQPALWRGITTDGVFTGLAFSPDGSQLAFYFGPREALSADGFSLMLLNVDKANSKPVSIAPPSAGYGMNTSRSAPLWSPDGKFIIFEACYSDQGFLHGEMHYILSVKDRRMITSGYRGAWDPQGKHFYAIRPKEKDRLPPGGFVAVEMDILKNSEKRIIHDLDLPGVFPYQIELSPSATKVAYFQNQPLDVTPSSVQKPIASKRIESTGDVLFIYDAATQKTTSFGHGTYNPLIWITPSEAGKAAEAKSRSSAIKSVSGTMTNFPYPWKADKNMRLLDTVAKIRSVETERNSIVVSGEDTREITEFFVSDGYMDRLPFPSPEQSNESRYYAQVQKEVEAWLLFRKVTQADSDAGADITVLLERERMWWKSRLNSHRKLIDDDIRDEEILAILVNRLELSAAKEEFLKNYFARKPR